MRGSGWWMVAGLAGRARRLVAAALATAIGVAFLTATLVVLETTDRAAGAAAAPGWAERDLVVTGWVTQPQADRLDALDEVEVLGRATTVWGERAPGRPVIGVPVGGAGTTVLSGRLPRSPEEGLAGTTLAEVAGLGAGSVLDVEMPGVDGPTSTTLSVVGVADLGEDPRLMGQEVFAAGDETLRGLDPALGYDAVLLDLGPGVGAEEGRDAVAAVVGADAEVRTGEDAASARTDELTGGTAVLGAVLLGFGAVALVTSALVIATTFAIVLAQRIGELALLRCVGATRSQLTRSVLVEAAVLGLVAGAAGAAGGVAVAGGVAWSLERWDVPVPMAGLAVSPAALLGPWAVGAVVTVLAALLPVARAARVSPLAALRPQAPAVGRAGVLRLLAAAVLVGGGVGLMLLAASVRLVPVGVLGGVVSFAGVLVGSVALVPGVVRGLGAAARLGGLPARLAVRDAVRNPGRAAATSAALVVGVTLITMTTVGAASADRTAQAQIDREFAVDAWVLAEPQVPEEGSEATEPVPLEDGLAAAVRQLPGVDATVPVGAADLEVSGDGWSSRQQVLGLDPTGAGGVFRSTEVLERLRPGTVGASADLLEGWGLEPGDVVTVSGPDARSADLTVVELGVGYTWLVHDSDLSRVAPEAPDRAGLLLRFSDDADVAAAMTDLRELVEGRPVSVDGAAALRGQLTDLLRTLVLVTTGLLGVAVLIAVIGIGNTLSLSVVERRREHALLRGLGLTRGQMRRMLLAEGVLLALASAVLGLALGVLYGWLGTQTVLPAGTTAALVVPWGPVGLIVLGAVVAGAVASVLPARRAVRIAPAAGLAAG